MKKHVVFVAAMLIVLPITASAHTVSVTVMDKYVVNKGITLHDGPVLQIDAFFGLRLGFYFDLWASKSLDRLSINDSFGNEIDLTLGWAGNVRGFGVDAGIAYFDLIELFSLNGGDVVQPFIELNKTFIPADAHTLTPYVRVEIMLPVGWEGNPSSGAHIFAGVKHNWKVLDRLALNQKAAVMYDTGTFAGFSSGILGSYDLGLSVALTESVSVGPTFKVVFPVSDLDDGRKTEYAFGGVVYKF